VSDVLASNHHECAPVSDELFDENEPHSTELLVTEDPITDEAVARFTQPALLLTLSTAAFAHTAVDATGRVVRIDPGAQVIILDSNQAFRVTPNTVLLVDNRPVTLGTLQPGQSVVIRAGEAVAMLPSASVNTQTPSTTTVIAAPSASPGLAQQTVYGQTLTLILVRSRSRPLRTTST
jgi:hypothetical protein